MLGTNLNVSLTEFNQRNQPAEESLILDSNFTLIPVILMQIAQVLGTVVSTIKAPNLRGGKFLLLQFLDETGEPVPGYEVALDYVGAGIGEWVLVSRGSAARQIEGSQGCPSDAAIVGIIDTVNTKTGTIYSKREQYR